MRRGAGIAAWICLTVSLVACTHSPDIKPTHSPVDLTFSTKPVAFRLDGRVSVKAGDESFSGGLSWRRDGADEELLLRTPLGQGVAELRSGPSGMELKNAEGRLYYAADADSLVRQALGMELPLSGLAWWVVGLPRPETTFQAIADGDGHLGELRQDGWQILFDRYDVFNGKTLPGKLIARRGDALEFRLVVDSWELN